MGYYMRFVSSDQHLVRAEDLAVAMTGSPCSVEGHGNDVVISRGETAIADVTLNSPGDGLFEEEIEELIEFLEDARGLRKRRVLAGLKGARQIVAVQILNGVEGMDRSIEYLDPFWNWLLANRHGLIQADGEGYYAGRKLILKVE